MGIKQGWRLVRIDHKTEIEVEPEISDDEAILRFHERQAYSQDSQNKRKGGYLKLRKEKSE